MKKFLIITLITIFCTQIKAQNAYKMNIDTSNYYKYYNEGVGLFTNNLNKSEVVPIIVEEFEHAGIKYSRGNVLFKLKNGQYIVLAALGDQPKIGIAYITGHFADVNLKDRNSGTEVTQRVDNEIGEADIYAIKVEDLPDYIYTLTENSYWYQYGNGKIDTTGLELVTKDVAIRLLRMDIKKIIKDFYNNEKPRRNR